MLGLLRLRLAVFREEEVELEVLEVLEGVGCCRVGLARDDEAWDDFDSRLMRRDREFLGGWASKLSS